MSKKGKKGIVLAAPCMATLSFQVLTLAKPKDGTFKTVKTVKFFGFYSGSNWFLVFTVALGDRPSKAHYR